METDNAASFAEPRKCTAEMAAAVLGPHGVTGAAVAPGLSPQQIEEARRNLTLAALRWQAALDADTTAVS